MKVSVIVPLFNAENYLSKLVEQFSKIKNDDIEFIFVNDGSTDKTVKICEDAKSVLRNLRVVNQPNGGASSARNTGIDIATGEYICFADCDDLPKENMYKALSTAADETACDMVMGGYEKIDADRNCSIVELPYHGFVPGGAKEIAWSMAFWSGFIDGKPIHTLYGSVWPNLYRKAIIDRYHIRFPQGVILGEDLLFNIAYLSHCDTIYMLNESLYQYSVGNVSATRKQIPDLWERYGKLADLTKRLLLNSFGGSVELQLNFDRQVMNFAISVIEEQILPFFPKDEQRRRIKQLCEDNVLSTAASHVFRHGITRKERMQGLLFKLKLSGFIYKWLSA